MRSFWRLLLVWLTALAIPVQGIAAAGMTHCLAASAPAHQHGAHDPSSPHPQHDPRLPHGHQDHGAMGGADHSLPHAHPAVAVHDEGPAGGAASKESSEAASEAFSEEASEELATTPSHPGKVTGVDKKCSACAACCAAAALPTGIAEVPVLDLASTPTCLPEASSASFIASGPERPPRPHLA